MTNAVDVSTPDLLVVDLSIVIVTYHAAAIAKECIDSFLTAIAQDPAHRYELIVVDNSEDASVVNRLKAYADRITLVDNARNEGFAKASNVGYANSRGRYILFSNPDILVNSSTLPEVVRYLEQSGDQVGACAPLIHLVETGERDCSSHKGQPTVWNIFTHYFGLARLCRSSKRLSSIFGRYYLAERDFSIEQEVESITGGFFVVRRNIFEAVGCWDEDYFLFGEDVELSYQIRKRDYKIMYIPQASVQHYQGATTGLFKFGQTDIEVNPRTKQRARRQFYAAMKTFFDKNFQRKRHKVVRPFIFAGISLRELLDICAEKHAAICTADPLPPAQSARLGNTVSPLFLSSAKAKHHWDVGENR